jgi:hypothetical protein
VNAELPWLDAYNGESTDALLALDGRCIADEDIADRLLAFIKDHRSAIRLP